MNQQLYLGHQDDSRLWLAALGLSLVFNAIILVVIGLVVIRSASFSRLRDLPAVPAAESVATILAEFAAPAPEVEEAPADDVRRPFARTSADQAAPPEDGARFIGERDTRAASERAPDPAAVPLPSQAGIEPRHEGEIETTVSDYQDGSLDSEELSASAAEPVAAAEPPVAAVEPADPGPAEARMDPAEVAEEGELAGLDPERSVPPPRERLLEGPNPVDVEVPVAEEADDAIKPTVEQRRAAAAESPPEPRDLAEPSAPSPAAAEEPAFRGYQRKTALVGSISRTGRSSLDVENNALGRYHAAISRAVEREWQRNCVRHRDFITPGFLTVRFFVEPSGKVRSVDFVGESTGGQVQKGFTLNSIRDAPIPPMPRELRAETGGEPLEIMFRFFF